SQLQRRSDFPSLDLAPQLSFVRTYRGCPQKMSRVRRRWADLLRIRHRESGGDGRAYLCEGGGETDGRRFNDTKGGLSRNAPRISDRQDRHFGWYPDDRERPAFSERYPGRNYQCGSGVTSARLSRGRTHISVADPSGGTRWPW